MNEQQILDEAYKVVLEVNKKALTNGKEKTVIGEHDLYSESVKMAEAISYHAVKGKFPSSLFANRSPNETPEETKYIKANYKQYTLNEYVDYLNTITRPFGDGNWAIDYNEEIEAFKNESFQQYVENELPTYGSLETFVKGVLPNIKSIDANGFVAIRPLDIEYIEETEGVFKVDSTVLPKPAIFYFESKQVIEFEDNEYYLFLSKEKSMVMYGGKYKEEGNIYELYTKDSVYFFIQTGNKTDNKFNIELYYQHDAGKCPVAQLKGIPNLTGDSILWQSPFIFGVDLLDCVTVNLNWLQFITNKCVFPMTIMMGSVCDFADSNGNVCQDGYIFNDGNKGTCPSCKGAGQVGRLSPLGTILINPATKFEPGEERSTQAPLSYVSPDITTLEFLEKKAESDRQKARQILHLQTSNSQVKGTENLTATGMVLDNKAMTAFVKPIIDQIFDIYLFCLQTIGFQRYGESFAEPVLTYPKSFDFKSPEDYLQDLTTAMEKNLPPAFIQTLLFQYINSFYGDSEKTTLIFKLTIAADRLFGSTQDEINMKLAKGTAAKWEDILHTSVLSFIADSIDENDIFLYLDKDVQVLKLQEMAKEIESEIKGTVLDITKTLLP